LAALEPNLETQCVSDDPANLGCAHTYSQSSEKGQPVSSASEVRQQRLVPSSRSRLITIRLTAAEYDLLHTVCHSEGARSVSDYARHCILRHVDGNHTVGPSLGDDLRTVSGRLNSLRQVIRECSDSIEKILGLQPNDSAL
jgi:hypothetical protein